MNKFVKSDLYRYTGKKTVGAAVKQFFINRAFRIQVFIRLSNGGGIQGKIAKVLYYANRYFYPNIQISYRCKIGYGLYIGHSGPVIVSRFTTFGSNVNLSQFVSIGTNSEKGATIGNNVYIGPNVSIVGDVTIGNNVTIGAGSVVTHDIPSNVTVAGNPARILNENIHHEFLQNTWDRIDEDEDENEKN